MVLTLYHCKSSKRMRGIEIQVTGAPVAMGYCHSNSCRSYSGSPVNAYLLWKAEDVTVTKETRCGGHLMTHHPTFGLTDVHASVPPRVMFEPVIHLHYAEAVLPMKDGLRKLRDFPVEAEDPASWLFPSSGAREATDKQRQFPALRALYAHTR